MIYNIPVRNNFQYYPETLNATWFVKLTHLCIYRETIYNKSYHIFRGDDVQTRGIFYILTPNTTAVY